MLSNKDLKLVVRKIQKYTADTVAEIYAMRRTLEILATLVKNRQDQEEVKK